MEVSGAGSKERFAREPGGHRWQRVPPTEKRGRRHTSTVTVAVFPMVEERELKIPDSEIEWEAIHGSGSGGQNKNRRATMIRMKHVPTGITVVCQRERDREQNRRTALRELRARVHFWHVSKREQQGHDARRRMVGSGMRGDKIRTIRMQDGVVRDHRTGRRTSVSRYLEGHVEDLS